MKKISFIFALHNHQPVGNFDHVIEHAYQHAYKPFLDVFEQHPKVTACIHNTGCLARWILEHHPDYFARLRTLVEEGRLEILGGGFNEPILSIIPTQDAVGQIEMLSSFVHQTIGEFPQGMWLAERVWEPRLPSLMHLAGMKYTVLDDSHFMASGLTEAETLGYYMTEDVGQAVAVFPTSEKLRYAIPFGKVEDVIAWMREHASEDGAQLAVLGDDGEKFGVWPKTYESVYEKGWLEDFFTAMEENSDWIEMTTFSKALKDIKPRGRVYLPTASYIEMMMWALPTNSVVRFEEFYEEMKKQRHDFSEIQPFLRGGFWRNFLAKYEESNQMHKRMMRTSQKVAVAKASAEKDDPQVATAQDLLWQGQCNCAYWHGVFGGLYLPHLRTGIYQSLIGSEATLRDSAKTAYVEQVDFDCDGLDEIFVESPALSVCIKPSAGGSIVELDDLRTRVNITDVLTRRPESYHVKVAKAMTWEESEALESVNTESATASIHDVVRTKEKGLEKLLIYDWYRRSFGLARFLPGWTTLEQFVAGKASEDGDFVNQPFTLESTQVQVDGTVEVVLVRHGGLFQAGGVRKITVKRIFHVDPQKASFGIRHEIENHSELEAAGMFGIEMVGNVLAPDAPDRFVFVDGRTLAKPQPNATSEELDVSVFGLVDGWRNWKMKVEVDRPAAKLWRTPIETVSLSEAGFERVYQGTCLLPLWPIAIKPGEKEVFKMRVSLESLEEGKD